MVGFLTMNYSPHRFLGAAIPVNLLKPVIKRLKESRPETGPDVPVAEDAEGWIGLKVKDGGGRVVIASVDASSPAQAKGLVAGMAITAVGGTKVASAAEYLAAVKGLKAGSTLFLTVDDSGIVDEVSLVLEKRP
jgi:S1-C subfamily serine protease